MTTTSTILSGVRQDSSLHLVNRNMRGGWGRCVCHNSTKNKNKNSHRTIRKLFPLESTHTMRLGLGSGHSHSENNDFPCPIREDVENQVSVRVSNTVLSLYIYFT